MTSPTSESPSANSVLDPVDRTSEVLFGLIMVLTFTCSISAGESGQQEVRAMLVGAISCNLAWGFVDAIMYLMANLTQRGRSFQTLRSIQQTKSPEDAYRIIREALPPVVASVLKSQELEAMRNQLIAMPEPPRNRLNKEDWVGAIGIFLLVFLSTFPVIIPFFFVKDPRLALRISNGVAIVLLFLCGYSLGRYAGDKSWKPGLAMVIVGVLLVAITMALGG
jgi:VIT family